VIKIKKTVVGISMTSPSYPLNEEGNEAYNLQPGEAVSKLKVQNRGLLILKLAHQCPLVSGVLCRGQQLLRGHKK